MPGTEATLVYGNGEGSITESCPSLLQIATHVLATQRTPTT